MTLEKTDVSTLLGVSKALQASRVAPAAADGLSAAAVAAAQVPDDAPKVPLSMSRDDYVRKQHAVLEALGGRESPLESNSDLLDMLELYMASLDEQVYNEVELQQQVLQRAEHVARSNLELLLNYTDDTDKYTYITEKLAQVTAVVSVLEADFTDTSIQRDKLDELRLELKNKYAVELARRLRLEHMVNVLVEKVVAQDKTIQERAVSHDTEVGALRQQLEQREIDAAVARAAPDHQLVEDFAALSVDEKLTHMYAQVLRLQNLDKEESPEKLVNQIFVYLDAAKSRKAQQVRELTRTVIAQHEAKQHELELAVSVANTQRDIFHSKAAHLETQLKEKADEIQGLIDRSVSLILTDKQLRSQLVSQNEILKRYESVIETSRVHIERLTAENHALSKENELRAGRSS